MTEDISNDKLLELYRNLLTARLVGGKLFEMYTAGDSGIYGFHRGDGEEAIPVGICANLRKDDYIKVTTRTRFCLFAKGISLRDVIATECHRDLAKVGGHNIFFDFDYGIIPYSGTLGEDVPITTGAALAEKLKKSDRVAVAIFGDATGNRGSIHESMAVAAVWKLPIVFVIQNNQYGMGTSVRKSYAIKDLSDRAKAYGFSGITIDGNDIVEVYEVSKEYIERARRGGGSGLIVAETYRLFGHYVGDNQRYRPKGEADEWWKNDPLPRYTKRLIDMGLITEDYIDKLDKELKAEINKAAEAALAVPHITQQDYLKNAIAEL
jgi:pyruvate dehydrogenase E1 component alpha subunit